MIEINPIYDSIKPRDYLTLTCYIDCHDLETIKKFNLNIAKYAGSTHLVFYQKSFDCEFTTRMTNTEKLRRPVWIRVYGDITVLKRLIAEQSVCHYKPVNCEVRVVAEEYLSVHILDNA